MRLRRLLFLITLSCLATLGFSACSVPQPWKKPEAGLQVQLTDSSNAQVYLDSLHLGSAPLNERGLKPGTYTIRIEPENLKDKRPYETQIHLYSGSSTAILWNFTTTSEPTGTGDILELEPLPSASRAELSVITMPEGASVQLNSTTYGLSPVVLDSVDAGQYSLTLSAVGHVKKTLGVQIQPGFRMHVFSKLEKEGSTAASPTPAATPTSIETNSNPNTPPTPAPTAAPRPTPVAAVTSSASANLTTPSKPYVTIKETGTGWLRVRDQASSAGKEVKQVNVGESFPYKSTLNGWYEIEYEPAKTGWISGQYGQLVR